MYVANMTLKAGACEAIFEPKFG